MTEQEHEAVEVLELDISEEDLTLGDLEALEEVTGPIPEDGLEGLPRTKVTIGLALVALRRKDPAATPADARAVKVSSLAQPEEAVTAEVNPTA